MTENKTSVTFNKAEIRANTKIAFDIDLTLITHEDRPILSVINILDWFVRGGFDVIIWSGGGVSYSEMWARRLGYSDRVRVIEKGSEEVDVAFDDEEFSLAKANICVPAVDHNGVQSIWQKPLPTLDDYTDIEDRSGEISFNDGLDDEE